MEINKAIEILHPDTTFQAITEIEYYGGFNGKEKAIEAVNEACIVACECMEKHIPKKPLSYDDCEKFIIKCTCGKCTDTRFFHGYCTWCGQKLES